ncbi:J domain-containing protein [Hymenobacter psychrotolerans]|uniref:DnaJ domain-containing protein n=1 Tax=Hymenobacter psychrotolerans DSM 18569 TaxID=1121959 RepID=A0A1M6Z4I3_9BACT|nr:J domain-containing protein [Hymenobacter psychrotolerans]SHL25312.1 DnaJ domain-containing protein [Hymenobacter psychrotolerans DSM 18569]
MTHYEVLEVSEQATAQEIRRAYRRLVLLTHPDRTPDPAAHRRYLAINEAYETLSSAARRQQYDAGLRPTSAPATGTAPPAAPVPPVHRDPALRRRGRPAARRRHVPTQPAQYKQEFARLAPLMRLVAAAGLLLALLLCVDAFQEEASVQRVSHMRCQQDGCQINTEQFSFSASADSLAPDDQVVVYHSPWFSQVWEVKVDSGKMAGAVLATSNVYTNVWLLPLLLGVAAAAALWPKQPAEYVFRLAFLSGVLCILCLIFLASFE